MTSCLASPVDDNGVHTRQILDEQHCEIGLRCLHKGRIEGMMLLATCICDLEQETAEWTRRWIAEVGEQPV